MSSYGSPVIDLIYFLFTSATEEMILESVDHMLTTYQTALSKELYKIESAQLIPSLEKLKLEWKNKMFHGKIILNNL